MISEENVISQVKSKTMSVTTSANGNASINEYYSKMIVIAATAQYSSDTIVTLYRYTNSGNEMIWGVHITDCSGSMNPKTGTFDVTIFYVDR